ncbi:uncharacterized protein LOC132554449 [Ylistrum balloti]|uniref:uncharacterized protein LOC132554449 n=1 Tax=Ylistrum balloti TaxID=509963 RepID=UPI002905D57E|nr:uncharacterized protein LOC132554449 [Ylistrum balloti]
MSKRPWNNKEDVPISKKKLVSPSSEKSPVKVPWNSIGVWRFGENDLFVTVLKSWSVSKCIENVRRELKENGDNGVFQLDLWVKNRSIMLDDQKSLSDYPGLTKLYVVRRPKFRNAPLRFQTSDNDVTDPFSDDTCVRMECGHAISPENLYTYAWNKITNGELEVTCPAIPDDNRPSEQCAKLWTFKSICSRACLSCDETNLFLTKLFLNWQDKNKNVYLCPKCDEAQQDTCERSVVKCRYCKYSFCVRCLGSVGVMFKTCQNSECKQSIPKVKQLLVNCSMRTLVGVPNCPSVRACPVCNCVIEYDEVESCKHMTCPRKFCQTKFCFICLKVKTDKYYWPCGGAFDPCTPAEIQIIEDTSQEN